ncbi:MAG TPA: ABC transporter substrate-binding protein [Candidatus Saccharimonadales bacterium]|nr:ABC transporter substrate-binding protein [Candidatus Saccharimonadales bacterium]
MSNRKAISASKAAVLIVVVIAVIGAGVYLANTSTTTPSTSSMTTSAAAAPSTLTIDETFWPIYDLNPIPCILYITGSSWWDYTVFQPLVTLNGTALYQKGDTTQIEPVLASSWTVSPDQTTYTFNLRQNVTFSNGDPFNAYQVWGDWYNFYYMSGNATNFFTGYGVFGNMTNVKFGPATNALMTQSGLVNPSPALMSIMTDSSWPIYVTGPYQIVIHLSHPFHWMLQVLTTFVGLQLDTQYILQNGGFGNPASGPNTYFNTHPIPGTGPYVTTDWQIGSYQKFTQNPTYWGKNLTPAEIQANPYVDPGHVATVFMYGKTDDVARYADLSSGTAQIATIYTQNFPNVLANPDKYAYFKVPSDSMIVDGIGMNTQRYPTNNLDFRLAVQHALNLTDINNKVFFGTLTPLVGPEYKAQKDYYDLGNFAPYSYNVTLAQQYLKQSGVDVTTLAPLSFTVISGCGPCLSTAQVVQAQLSSALGITVNVNVLPPSEMTIPYTAGYSSYAASLPVAQQESHFTWMGFPTYAPNAPTPADSWLFWVNLNSPSGNYANYGNAVVQQCVDSWFNGADVTTITTLCTAAQASIYHDAPYIWVGSPTQAFGAGSVVWNKNVVQGFLMDPGFTGEVTSAIFNTVTFVGS